MKEFIKHFYDRDALKIVFYLKLNQLNCQTAKTKNSI